MHHQRFLAHNRDRAAQSVERQPFGQIARRLALAIDQQIIAVGPHQKVEQTFALRAEQPRPARQVAHNVVCHQPLQEAAHILA